MSKLFECLLKSVFVRLVCEDINDFFFTHKFCVTHFPVVIFRIS